MALDSREDFFGCKLSKDNKQYVWSSPDDSEADIEHKLQITQACLGIEAKQGERNVIDVTTTNEDDEEITHTILSLQLGLTDMTRCELGFLNKTTFKLVKGNGPVHLTGLHMQAAFPGTDSDEEDEDESSEEELMVPKLVEMNKTNKNAKPVTDEKPASKQNESKKAKTEAQKDKLKTDSSKSKEVKKDVESSDDSDDEEEKNQEVLKKAKDLIDDEAIEDDEDMDSEEEEEDDSDIDDEDLDDEDDDEEDDLDDDDDNLDDDESDENESDEEEEAKPPSSKKAKVMVNGHKDAKNKTPVKKADAKTKENQKTPQTEKKTPKNKNAGKGPKTPAGTPSVDDIKKKLSKSPNLPKTAEKFKNFMKSAHKVVDDDTVKSLWDWVQKNKK